MQASGPATRARCSWAAFRLAVPAAFAAAIAWSGCADNPGDIDEPSDRLDPDVALLSPTDHLIRASMALRGIRPSVDELDAVADDPDAIEALVADYIQSEQFLLTMRELHNESLLARAQTINLPVFGGLTGYQVSEVNRSVTEAPLELIVHVIANDRPYTEIVTADYTLADPIVATVWGLPHSGSDDWEVTAWTDGRPAAGILSSSSLFLRHRSAAANWHRGRANRISKALLCYDFLARDVIIDASIDLSDPDAVANAVVDNQACASCHQPLDPLASFFWGHQGAIVTNDIEAYPVPFYRPQRERAWEVTSGRAPTYFGQPGDDLADLGGMIAEDSRFSLCTAQRFFAYLAQVELDAVPLELAAALQDEFIASGYDAKALALAVVLSPEFRASHGETDDAAENLAGYKKVRPAQLGRMIEDLTGFRWEAQPPVQIGGAPYGRVPLTENDLFGFRVLGGGIDSVFVTQPSRTINATTSLLIRGLAAEAAAFAVDRDFSGTPRLLTRVSANDTDEDTIRGQLAALHYRLYGEAVAADSPEVDDSYRLFAGALAIGGDPRRAWTTTLTGMLQDIRVGYY